MAKRPDESKEKTEALIRQSDEVVFGDGPAQFVSKQSFALSDVVARVRDIDWLVHCGETRDFEVTMPVERVKTWSQATKATKSRAWENAKVEAKNQLTVYLSRHHRERYGEWNKIVDSFNRDVVAPLKENVWEPYQKRHELDVNLPNLLQWNILGVLMENAYMDCQHGCFFFHELLAVYEAGQLPCGWIGEWPQGKLVVY